MINTKSLHNQKSSIKRITRVIGNTLFIILLLLIGIAAFFSIQNRAFGKTPSLGGYFLYTVMSGSMEPKIKTGSIIFDRPINAEQLSVNDIITFKSTNNQLVTHRIVEILNEGSLYFITRGDANNANDQQTVTAKDIVGKVDFDIPYIGYLINLVQSKHGVLFLIIIPGTVLLVLEIRKLIKYAILIDREKEKKKMDEAEKKTFERSESLEASD